MGSYKNRTFTLKRVTGWCSMSVENDLRQHTIVLKSKQIVVTGGIFDLFIQSFTEWADYWLAVFCRFPETLLGSPDEREQFWDPLRGEYFINRNQVSNNWNNQHGQITNICNISEHHYFLGGIWLCVILLPIKRPNLSTSKHSWTSFQRRNRVLPVRKLQISLGFRFS